MTLQRPENVAWRHWALSENGPSTRRTSLLVLFSGFGFAFALSCVFLLSAFAKSQPDSGLTRKEHDPSRSSFSALIPTSAHSSIKKDWKFSIPVLNSPRITTNALSVTCTNNPIVTNNADNGAGSLRQAILDACDGTTITFSSLFSTSQTIGLVSTLQIGKSLTISGPGANLLTISGSNSVPVLGISTTNSTVTISALTIANGNSTGAVFASGGGISNNATLNIIDSAVSSNSVTNTCTGSLCNGAEGGGIYNTGTVNILRSTISGNSVFISAHGQSAVGGGISNRGTLTITNSTVANNSAFGSSGGAFGGGINGGSLIITKTTIAGNSAGGGTGSACGGICAGTATVSNSIIANNTAPFLPYQAPELKGSFTSNGYNIIGKSDGSTGFTNGVNNDQVGSVTAPIDPLLGALANNGGPTQTMALLSSSPAIDKGSAIVGITLDQRGLTRPVDLSGYANAAGGDGSDIGAFEVQVGAPDHLQFEVQPTDTLVGNTITPAVSVRILDASNNTTTSTASVSLSIGANPNGGSLTGTTTVAAVNGTATFGDLSISRSGTGYSLIASSTVPGATSNSFAITCPTITVGPSSLPNGTLGFAYTSSLSATGGTTPFSFAVTSGNVPTGLILNSNGMLTGTPTSVGTFNFTITATAESGCIGSRAYSVFINALTISGQITRGGSAFSGVTVTLSGAQSSSTVTDSNGNYSFTNIAGNANYSVTPSRTNYTFVPTNAVFNNLQANASANFAGTIVNYGISGKVTVGAGGLSGVTVTLSGNQTNAVVTDNNGNYSLLNVAGDGDYTVTPSLAGYTFTPTSRSFNKLSANQTLADFVASPKISGQIKNSNNVPLNSVVVVLSGTTSATDVSDANGNFSFVGLTVGGNYVVTPARTNYAFSPTLRTFTNLTAAQTADFVGTLANYTISGRVSDASNAGVEGVVIALTGSQAGTATTVTDGSFSFTVPGDGNYTITPTGTDYAFAPLNFTFNSLSQNQNAVNFTTTAIPQLLLQSNVSAQVTALDSVLFLVDPFSVVNTADLFFAGTDHNTRVTIFAANLRLSAGEPSSAVLVNLVDSNNQSYDIPAEDVRPIPNFPFEQITFRLPDNMTAATYGIKIVAHGQSSNAGTIRIRQ